MFHSLLCKICSCHFLVSLLYYYHYYFIISFHLFAKGYTYNSVDIVVRVHFFADAFLFFC